MAERTMTQAQFADYDTKQQQARALAEQAIAGLFAQWIASGHTADRTGAHIARAVTYCLGRAIMQRPMDIPPIEAVELMAGSIIEGMRSVDPTAFSQRPVTPARPQ